jgi:hypothetical protein
LDDDHVYCYATANVEQGQRSNDERKELQRRFGHWHQPIPQIIDSISPSDVIRTDIVEIAEPLTALHRGRGLLLGDAAHAMTPEPSLRLPAPGPRSTTHSSCTPISGPGAAPTWSGVHGAAAGSTRPRPSSLEPWRG